MANELAPTKANLMKAKENLIFSRSGFSLLDKKRTVLIREAMGLVGKAETLQKQIKEGFEEAYASLQMVNLSIGINTADEIAMSIPGRENFDILYRSVMGLEVPTVVFERDELLHTDYSFFQTNQAVDQTVMKFKNLRYLIYELAEVENAVFKIAMEIKKTAKRANALEKIQIPRYEEAVKYARTREQFGKPIGAQQNLAFKLADMLTKIEAARLLIYKAAEKKENHEDYGLDSAMAKMYASDIALEVVNDALQIHGGSGFIKGIPVEKMYRDAKITTIYEGTNEIQRLVIASKILGKLGKANR